MIKKGFSYIGIFFLQLLSLLPLWFLLFIARLFYYPVYYLIGYRKKVVRENLTKSFPEKSENEIIDIEKKFFKYFLDLIFETIKLASLSKSELQKRVTFTDTSLIDSYLANGQSILLAASHYCNWEYFTIATGLRLKAENYPIYKPLNNPVFGNWLHKARTKFGNHFIEMKQTYRSMANTANEVSVYYFGSDQTPVKHDIQYSTHFLNQSTPAFLGLERISVKTNRPIFYIDVRFVKRGYYQISLVPLFLNPKETKEYQITDEYFAFLENIIKERPEFWLWSHKRWKYAQPTNQQ
ncbi:MAG: lysophospholipid acyltransferase family protein [Sphingobacteriaceae bacterium]|nr:lysophospholipid acyltransferase family protein [Sphingobacteriaceae bacterium]